MDKSFLKIDPFALDKEWLNQPSLYMDMAEKAANARKDYDEAKRELDLVEAALFAKVRKSPLKYDLPEKPTEGACRSHVLTMPAYSDAFKEVVEAKHRLDIYSAAVVALEHRKRALTLLVELHGQSAVWVSARKKLTPKRTTSDYFTFPKNKPKHQHHITWHAKKSVVIRPQRTFPRSVPLVALKASA